MCSSDLLKMAQAVQGEVIINEQVLVDRFAERVEKDEVRLFVSKMLQVNALDLIEEVNYATP